MKISKALKLAAKAKSTVSSKRAGSYKQDKDSLLHWILTANGSTDLQKVNELIAMLQADDLEVDKK